MTDFIRKLNYTSDTTAVMLDLNHILTNFASWEPDNQLGLRHRINSANQWKDSVGGLYDKVQKVVIATEFDFNKWNDNCPLYTKSILEELGKNEGVSWGRIRFMLSRPKTGLSMHTDAEPRYHLVIQTNDNCIFGECFKNSNVRSIGYHIPMDSHWYMIDTTREHFIYNGGWSPRIHLVCCPTTP